MTWRQWNDHFRQTVRHFVKSDPGWVGELILRLYGSDDYFPENLSYRPYQSVNYVSSHDDPTLYDLVAYNRNDAWNCGNSDGDVDITPEVMRLRHRQAKNMLSLVFLANGTPMIRAGDEFLQTQNGESNPYSTDSPKTWLDWSKLGTNAGFYRFCKQLIAFRKQHPTIARQTFWRDSLKCYGVAGPPDWSPGSRAIAYYLDGASEGDDDLYVIINAFWEPLTFTIGAASANARWQRVIDTYEESPADFLEQPAALTDLSYQAGPRSVVVLLRAGAVSRSSG
jgi:glycogen operon protein